MERSIQKQEWMTDKILHLMDNRKTFNEKYEQQYKQMQTSVEHKSEQQRTISIKRNVKKQKNYGQKTTFLIDIKK